MSKASVAKKLLAGIAAAGGMDYIISDGDYSDVSKGRVARGILNVFLGSRALDKGYGPGRAAADIVVKDLMLAAVPTVAKLPQTLREYNTNAADQAQATSDIAAVTDRGNVTKGLVGGAAIGAGLYGALKLRDALKHQKLTVAETPEEARVKITLPTKAKGDTETMIDLPLSEINLSKSIRSGLSRDIKRRLREENAERVRSRKVAPKIEDATFEMLEPAEKVAAAFKSPFNVLGASNQPIRPINFGADTQPPPPPPPPQKTEIQQTVKVEPLKMSPALKGMISDARGRITKSYQTATKVSYVSNPQSAALGINTQQGVVGSGAGAMKFNGLFADHNARITANMYGMTYDDNAGIRDKAPETRGQAIAYGARRFGRGVGNALQGHAANVVTPIISQGLRVAQTADQTKEHFSRIGNGDGFAESAYNLGEGLAGIGKTAWEGLKTAPTALGALPDAIGWGNPMEYFGHKIKPLDYDSVRSDMYKSSTDKKKEDASYDWMNAGIRRRQQ